MKTLTKLVGLSCVLSAFTALVALYCINGLGKITNEAEMLYNTHLLGIHYTDKFNYDVQLLVKEEKNIIISDNASDIAKFISIHEGERKGLDNDFMELKKRFVTEAGKDLVAELGMSLAEWLKVHEETVRLGNTTDPEQNKKAQNFSLNMERPKLEELTRMVEKAIAFKEEYAKGQADNIASASANIRLISVIATIASVICGLGIGFFIAHGIVKQLGDEPGSIASLAHRIAEGDLTVRFDPARPEIGVFGAMKKMVEALKGEIAEAEQKGQQALTESQRAKEAMAEAHAAREKAETAKAEGMLQAASQLEGVVEVVTSASEELSAQIEQSSRGAEDQSSRVSETATAMEEMNATVLEVAKNAAHAAETAENARNKAQDGEGIVHMVVKGIGEAQKQALELKQDMGSLGEQAEGIGRVMNVISDIADQTNLLALNAAIEAARAGEAGRGFAVVADEVRKLAEKTMTATKEVGDAIRGIQDGTRKNMDNVDHAVRSIEEATGLAGRSGESLREIVVLVEQASDQVRSIATASEQQSSASEEINHSVEQVATISTQTAQAMTQAAQAVSELARQSQVLQNLIMGMKSEGGAAANHGPKAVPGRVVPALA